MGGAQIAVRSRGGCSFADKALVAQRAGHAALVIVDYDALATAAAAAAAPATEAEAPPPPALGDADVRIPVVSVHFETGRQLRDAQQQARAAAAAADGDTRLDVAAAAMMPRLRVALTLDGADALVEGLSPGALAASLYGAIPGTAGRERERERGQRDQRVRQPPSHGAGDDEL